MAQLEKDPQNPKFSPKLPIESFKGSASNFSHITIHQITIGCTKLCAFQPTYPLRDSTYISVRENNPINSN